MKKKKKQCSQSQKVKKKYNNAGNLSLNESSLSSNSPDETLSPSYDHSDHNKKLQNRRRLFTSHLFPALDEPFIKQMVYSEKECHQDKGIIVLQYSSLFNLNISDIIFFGKTIKTMLSPYF